MIISGGVEEYRRRGLLPRGVYEQVMTGVNNLSSVLLDIEVATGIKYPPAEVKPYLIVLVYTGDIEYEANVYARTVVKPSETTGVGFVIEFTAPLLAYASIETVKAVAAHEMAHYVEILKRLVGLKLTSEPPPDSLFETLAIDESLSVDPERLFGSGSEYTKLVREVFKNGLRDEKLEERVEREWVGRGLPVVKINSEENIVKIPVESILSLSVDDELLAKLGGL